MTNWNMTSSYFYKFIWLFVFVGIMALRTEVLLAQGPFPPTITSTAVTTAVVGQLYQYDVDADGDPVPSYNFVGAVPDGMTIDSGSGLISWTPTTSQTGDHNITVEAVNSEGSDPQSFTITVNEAPVINSTAVTSATVGQLYEYDVEASGYPAPSYSFVGSVPSGMTINSGSGLISWTPTTGQTGDHNITVEVINSEGSDSQSFIITVSEAPVITSTAILIAAVGQLYEYDVDASGDPAPTYNLLNGPTGMTIDSATGLISWTPAAGQQGDNTVEVEAVNDGGNDTQQFTIDVGTVPQINSIPSANLAVGDSYNETAVSSGDPAPTFSLENAPPGMTIDSNTGQISWTANQQGAGVNIITVRATNIHGSDATTLVLTVQSTAICLSETLSYWPFDNNMTSDLSSPDLTWSNDATCSPGSSCPLPASGRINGAATFNAAQEDALWVADAASLDWSDSSSFTIQVWVNTTQDCTGNKVFAGKFRDADTSQGDWWLGCGDRDGNEDVPIFALRQGNPTIDLKIAGTTPITDGQWHHVVAVRDNATNENRLYVDGILVASASINYTATLANDEPLTIGRFTSSSNPSQSFLYNGFLDELMIHNQALTSEQVRQSYLYGNAGVVTCSETAVAPQIISTANTAAFAGLTYVYDVQATGLPAPTYSLLGTPPVGMGVNSNTGLIFWPVPDNFGEETVTVTVQASNDAGTDDQPYMITVEIVYFNFLPVVIR